MIEINPGPCASYKPMPRGNKEIENAAAGREYQLAFTQCLAGYVVAGRVQPPTVESRHTMSEDFTPQTDNRRHVFDVFAEIAKLPSDSDSMLMDEYFSDFPSASSRIFRI